MILGRRIRLFNDAFCNLEFPHELDIMSKQQSDLQVGSSEALCHRISSSRGCESFKPRSLLGFFIGADDWLAANVRGSPKLASHGPPGGKSVVHLAHPSLSGTFAAVIYDLATCARSDESIWHALSYALKI